MIVAITGGTGFIGNKLALAHLARGDEVRILSRSSPALPVNRVKYFSGDLIAKDNSLQPFVDGVDLLYHCAGQLTDENAMRSLHVEGTQKLVEAATCSGIGHWVQLSSVGVYGPVSDGMITESFPIKPVGEYEVTKAESDAIVLAAVKNGAFSCSVLRPSNVFASDMKNQSLFSMINMIDRGLFFFIGKPGASANYIHVDNVVEGLIQCGTNPAAKGKIYNLSDHSALEAFVQIIASELGRRSPSLRLPEGFMRWACKVTSGIPGLPLTQARVDALTNRSVYSIARIQKELGYEHVISMENGLKDLVSGYQRRQ
ncbi:NAD-dependent epimerase/dehydratase family protein [Mariprofundus sp. NF]|uniref:NAD-dependent epimerase/dehydratase family protein n=1 Tax=Mariprofundus sp. NF TaxID=2608716 RepID=UPI0015A3186F|nr:NAD-dependent epimerase/dehydratase family protein [Mariprofundus sp. NF]NWF37945.1 NAD-dependent epimerase/dehydratase family protein [Mariprofundus sp. NF]